MNRFLHTVFSFILAVLLAIPTAFLVTAQSATEIKINLVSKVEQPDGMVLKVYFTLVDDKTGQAVLNPDFASAQVTLINRNLVSNAEIKQPDVPIYITMVLDASGSMAQAAQTLKDAAKLALNNTPDNSLFGVVQFDEQIQLLQDFTENISSVSYAIDQYKVSNRGTCLYDAAYTAIEALEKAPPGRRAVILFTDGKDEKRDGSVCSQHTYQELLKLANEKQVPINTIGLSAPNSKINSAELEAMASGSGGFSAIGSQTDLGQAFNQIMDALKAQRMAEATIYPKSGANDTVLKVTLKDNTALNVAFTVDSSTDYPGPPSPVSAKIAGLQYEADSQTYDLQLSMTSPELVSYIKVSVWDDEAGIKVGEYVFKDPVANNTLSFPTDKMTPDRKFTLHILAVSKADNTPFKLGKADQGDQPTEELIHEFEFKPQFPTIELRSVVPLDNDLVVTVGVTNPQLIASYEGWLVDENTNTQVPNSSFKVASLASDGTIRVPMYDNKVPDGKYKLVLRALGKEGQEYSKAEYSGVIYKAVRPSTFQRLTMALIAAPIILFSIVGIIVLVVAFLIFNSMREKSLSGTPVMQGRLGGKSKKGGKGGMLAVADDEPLPVKGKVAAPMRPPAPAPLSRPPSQPTPAYPVPQAAPSTLQQNAGEVTMITSPAESGGATMVVGRASTPSLTVTRSDQDGSVVGRKVPILQMPFVIGRTTGAFVIQDGSISRQHCQIGFDESRRAYVLSDLNSSNGTRLNGAGVTPGQLYPLTNGAMIELGPNVALRFELA